MVNQQDNQRPDRNQPHPTNDRGYGSSQPKSPDRSSDKSRADDISRDRKSTDESREESRKPF